MSYNKDGWIVDKKRVAFYLFAGDKSRDKDIDDLICEDAVNLIISELELIKVGLSSSVDKTDPSLQLALTFFTCCLMTKTGLAMQKSGVIQSESMEGMSISYGGEASPSTIKNPIPKDFCAMGQDQLNRYALKKKLYARGVKIGIKNYREPLIGHIYNKNRNDSKWGE